MDEPLHACPLGLAREPFCRFHMQGMKGLCSAFAIEADGIHHAISSSDRCRNRVFVVGYRRVSIEPGILRRDSEPAQDAARRSEPVGFGRVGGGQRAVREILFRQTR